MQVTLELEAQTTFTWMERDRMIETSITFLLALQSIAIYITLTNKDTLFKHFIMR